MKSFTAILSSLLFCACLYADQEVRPLRVVSIDGGAMLGLIPLRVLEKIENETGKPIVELVDGMMGSSSGGIIAAMLSTPKAQWDMTPKFSATEIHETYVANGRAVFNVQALTNAVGHFAGVQTLTDNERAAANLEALFERNVGHVYMSHVLNPLMIAAYHTVDKRIGIFDSELAKNYAQHDLPLKHALRATSAVEFLFGLGTVKFNTTIAQSNWIDAGRVGYNDPTAFFCERLLKRYPDRDIVVYSLGTGFGTSSRTRAYMQGHHARLKVVRVEPNLEDRKDTAVHALISLFSKSEARSDNTDVNLLAAALMPGDIAYIEKKALEVLESPEFKEMLADLKQ